MQRLRTIVQYLEVQDGNMEEGSFRCDANVAAAGRRPRIWHQSRDQEPELFRNVQRALEYEVVRQTKALEAGEKLLQETRFVGYHSRRHSLHAQQRIRA